MSAPFDWQEAPISRGHNRAAFDCGVELLNLYLRNYARQNHTAGGSKTFVAVLPERPEIVLGYYSISPGEIEFPKVPLVVKRGLGDYNVPVFRLGRLAVDRTVQGRGLGSGLLAVAIDRALRVRQQVGGVALAIDAKDARAAAWYESHGALPLMDDPLKLLLPLATAEKASRLGM